MSVSAGMRPEPHYALEGRRVFSLDDGLAGAYRWFLDHVADVAETGRGR